MTVARLSDGSLAVRPEPTLDPAVPRVVTPAGRDAEPPDDDPVEGGEGGFRRVALPVRLEPGGRRDWSSLVRSGCAAGGAERGVAEVGLAPDPDDPEVAEPVPDEDVAPPRRTA